MTVEGIYNSLIYEVSDTKYNVRSDKDGRLDGKTKADVERERRGWHEGGSWMFAKKKTEGRKEGRNIARQKRRHSECNPRTDCFQILMSRDLLYPRLVRWSE